MTPLLRTAGAAAVLAVSAACASVTPAPPPVQVAGPAADAAASSAEAVAQPGASGWWLRSPATAALVPVPLPTPPAPWLEPTIRLQPEAPAEGSALGVRIRFPDLGRRPEAVELELDGRPVPVATIGSEWFGIAALPIGASGTRLLTVRFRLPGDSVLDRHLPVRVEPREYAAVRLRVQPRYSAPPAELLERIAEERRAVGEALARVTPEWLAAAAFDWPRPPRVTSPFGQRRLFNGELRSRHTGLDLAGRDGDPVRAAADGRVAFTGDLFYQGGAVYVDHGLGVYTGYFHLSGIEVEPGDEVTRGQVVGRVGATGRVTGPHLHWAAYVDGQTLDPATLLELLPPGAAPAPTATADAESTDPTSGEATAAAREEPDAPAAPGGSGDGGA